MRLTGCVIGSALFSETCQSVLCCQGRPRPAQWPFNAAFRIPWTFYECCIDRCAHPCMARGCAKGRGRRGVWGLGGKRKGTYRKERATHTRHRGEREKYLAMINPHMYLFAPVFVYVHAVFTVTFSIATPSLQPSVSALCRQPHNPQRKVDTVTLNFPSRHGTGETSCCWQKEGDDIVGYQAEK